MERNGKSVIEKILSVAVAGTLSLGVADKKVDGAEMYVRPVQETPLVAGNIYDFEVIVDNTGLGGVPTDGVQWRFLNTPNFNYISSSAPLPTNDFFSGEPMFIDSISPPGGASVRIINEIGGGPVDIVKPVAVYTFGIPLSTTSGTYNFGLSNTLVINPDGDPQAHTTSNGLITVAGDSPADFNKDGYVNDADYQHIAGCLTGPGTYDLSTNGCADADFDADSDVDSPNVAEFQRQFTGTGLVQ